MRQHQEHQRAKLAAQTALLLLPVMHRGSMHQLLPYLMLKHCNPCSSHEGSVGRLLTGTAMQGSQQQTLLTGTAMQGSRAAPQQGPAPGCAPGHQQQQNPCASADAGGGGGGGGHPKLLVQWGAPPSTEGAVHPA